MDVVTTVGSVATVFCGVAVALVKFGFPSLPSWAVMLTAVLSGVGGALGYHYFPEVAQVVFAGVLAAAAAAGISRADRSADEKRAYVQNQDGVK